MASSEPFVTIQIKVMAQKRINDQFWVVVEMNGENYPLFAFDTVDEAKAAAEDLYQTASSQPGAEIIPFSKGVNA